MKIETVEVTQLELAEALGVTQPTLSEATSEGYYCSGRPVQEWAQTDESGRVSGYEVPASLVSEEQEDKKDFAEEDGPAPLSEESTKEGQSPASEETTEEKPKIGLKGGFGTLALAMGVKATLEK